MCYDMIGLGAQIINIIIGLIINLIKRAEIIVQREGESPL